MSGVRQSLARPLQRWLPQSEPPLSRDDDVLRDPPQATTVQEVRRSLIKSLRVDQIGKGHDGHTCTSFLALAGARPALAHIAYSSSSKARGQEGGPAQHASRELGTVAETTELGGKEEASRSKECRQRRAWPELSAAGVHLAEAIAVPVVDTNCRLPRGQIETR